MSVREIPKSYEYTCDGCGRKHVQEGATGHYRNSSPPGWAKILWRPSEGSDTEWSLCEKCKQFITRQLGLPAEADDGPEGEPP